MKGIWYSVRGDRPAHWHERIERPDGTALWAALSRCGMSAVVPSMLADKAARLTADPGAPDFDRSFTCGTCRRLVARAASTGGKSPCHR